jgi:hypothetical protein
MTGGKAIIDPEALLFIVINNGRSLGDVEDAWDLGAGPSQYRLAHETRDRRSP